MEKIIIDGKEYEKVIKDTSYVGCINVTPPTCVHCDAPRKACNHSCGYGSYVLKLIKTNNMEDLTNAHGKYFTSKFKGVNITGKVSIINNYIKLLFDQTVGSHTFIVFESNAFKDMVDTGSSVSGRFTNFKLIPDSTIDPETYWDWKVGDRVYSIKDNRHGCINAILNDITFIVTDQNNTINPNTKITLFEYGWRLDVPNPIAKAPYIEPTEYTLEDIAKLVGKDVKDIRIKD